MEAFLICTGIMIAFVGVIVIRDAFEGESISLGVLGSIIMIFGFFLFGVAAAYIGEKKGAYRQLRGQYEITYEIDKDSCVIDTIIHLRH